MWTSKLEPLQPCHCHCGNDTHATIRFIFELYVYVTIRFDYTYPADAVRTVEFERHFGSCTRAEFGTSVYTYYIRIVFSWKVIPQYSHVWLKQMHANNIYKISIFIKKKNRIHYHLQIQENISTADGLYLRQGFYRCDNSSISRRTALGVNK